MGWMGLVSSDMLMCCCHGGLAALTKLRCLAGGARIYELGGQIKKKKKFGGLKL
jgi:hypothetical protein